MKVVILSKAFKSDNNPHKMIKVFIEQTTRPNEKNVFDKTTGKHSDTIYSPLTYPYPYGYIPDTKAPDGDELDCYVISNNNFKIGDIIKCDPIGMVEWFEDGEADHKILAIPVGESHEIDSEVKNKIESFANQFIAIRADKKYELGEYYGQDKAELLIDESCIK